MTPVGGGPGAVDAGPVGLPVNSGSDSAGGGLPVPGAGTLELPVGAGFASVNPVLLELGASLGTAGDALEFEVAAPGAAVVGLPLPLELGGGASGTADVEAGALPVSLTLGATSCGRDGSPSPQPAAASRAVT